MTVATQTKSVTANGNDSATTFSFSPIVIFASTDLVVTRVNAAGVETVLSEGSTSTTYSVSVSSYPGTGSITYPASGGTPLPTGESLVMKRVLTLEQQTDLENQGGYDAEVLETQLDKLLMIDLQQQEEIDRSMKMPIGQGASVSAELPVPVADRVLGWNSDGDALVNNANAGDLNTTAFTETLLGDADAGAFMDTLGITAFAQTILDDANAAAVRATIDAAALAAANVFTKTQTWKVGSDVASDTALTLGDGNFFDITGTTTITSIGTKGVGTLVALQFDGAATLTHHATDLILPGAANITTAAGDIGVFYEYATGDWRCVSYQRASGLPVKGGLVVQRVVATDAAMATGTTAIPNDDTLPQITEGDEYITISITPKASANRLRIEGVLHFSAVTDPTAFCAALFQDSTADALHVFGKLAVAARLVALPVFHEMQAGTTSATTFRIRAGTAAAATVTFNGESGSRLYGGALVSTLTVTEYTPSN